MKKTTVFWILLVIIIFVVAQVYYESYRKYLIPTPDPNNTEYACKKWKRDYKNARGMVRQYEKIKVSEATADELATYSHFKSALARAKAKLDSLGCDYTP